MTIDAMTRETAASAPIVDPETMIRNELMSVLPHLLRLPDQIDRVLTLTGRGELRLRTIVDEDSRRVLRTLGNRALLAAVGAALLFASTALLVAPDAGPLVASGTGLFEVLGYGGLLSGIVLELRVVGAVVRDGTT